MTDAARYLAGLCCAALAHADRQQALAYHLARAAGVSGAAAEYWRLVAGGAPSRETSRWRRPSPTPYTREDTGE